MRAYAVVLPRSAFLPYIQGVAVDVNVDLEKYHSYAVIVEPEVNFEVRVRVSYSLRPSLILWMGLLEFTRICVDSS